jgi:hypothetical protein
MDDSAEIWETTCPACGHVAAAPATACPLCGVTLPVPAGETAALPPITTFNCPYRRKELPTLCLFCPHCDEP